MFLAATVGWLLIAGVSRPVDAAGGSTCTLAPTSGTIMRQVDGRRYAVNVPGGLSGPSAPLLLALHGFTQLPTDHEAVTGWSQVASAQHFIVAYPSAQPERGAWDFSQGSRDEWLARLQAHDVPCGPISALDEVAADPQVQHLELVQEVTHPKVGAMKVVVMR